MPMIPIPHVGLRVAALTGAPGLSPRKIYDLALRGAFPATFENGRWFVAEQDIPAVAYALGFDVPSHASASAARKNRAAPFACRLSKMRPA